MTVLHGLEGSSRSGYAAAILRRLAQTGFQGVLMHARGCSGQPNRLHRAYHAGETGDMSHVVDALRTRFPDRPIAAVGYSLGGNALLKWLGETGADNPLATAVAVSVPFLLAHAHERLQGGFSRLYQWHLMGKMKRSVRRKRDLPGYPVDVAAVQRLTTFREFDDRVTAPLHGFAGVDDYYTRSSSRQFLAGVQRPTLVLHARNDPFMFAHSVPTAQELSPHIRLELSEHGGHVGFVEGRIPGFARYWLERRIPQWLGETLV